MRRSALGAALAAAVVVACIAALTYYHLLIPTEYSVKYNHNCSDGDGESRKRVQH